MTVYADGKGFQAQDSRTGKVQRGVFRVHPNLLSQYYTHVWTENDRIDVLAQMVYGSSDKWIKIMDYNPEIINPLNIVPGTEVRLPSD